MLSSTLATIAKLSLVLGSVFVVLKIVYKRTGNKRYRAFYERWGSPLYRVHVNVSKLAVFAAFIHGFTVKPADQIFSVTGWILGLSLVILLGTGAFLSIKNDSRPMDEEGDRRWRTIRMVKWILTAAVIPLLLLHYKLYDWLV
jgi:hypothetical protein